MQFTSNLKKIFIAAFFVIILYLIMAFALQTIGLDNAQLFIKQTGVWSPLVFIALCALSLIIAPLSGSSLFVIGGTLFGRHNAFLLSYIATIIGCSANFCISRKFGRKVVQRFIGKANLDELDKFINRFKNHRSIFYMIIIMPLSQDLISYAIGLTKIKYPHFLIALILSSTIVVSGYVYIGSSILETLIQSK
ncbi:TVP38/TMEM64 family protein [Plectonema cf. radiosum LEGE 06105]|uniref:TVP38/TMEM64 family membrane protein n=1 Tax=Plectonema cf. radiosum LEGE 06105 TaxID=945769 RepID=A0A8J7K632_9CYAN|nr:VTT domain-containing protein [Plectonema radiosum]MBE9215487.1 TVP38/TMEM64 family protein [Plectonema cf. radiosum LEGE 06105]